MGETVEIAVAAAVAATFVLALVALILWLESRGRRRTEARMEELTAALGARVEQAVAETRAATAVEDSPLRRSPHAEIGGSIDLDEVLARTLEAAGALPGVDAALVSVGAESDKPVVATLGLSDEEARRQAVSGPPDGREARSIAMTYQYGGLGGGADAIHGGLAVPLRAESGSTGFLTIFTRARGHAFAEADIAELESLAARAGPAIDNARRFREARQLADLDALTGLHNRRYFHETLEREVARAQRYNRRLALLVFDLDDFKSVNDRIGHLAGDAVLAEAADRVREVVRTTDVPCRVGGDEFAIILPESTLDDADQLYTRLRNAVSARPVAGAGIVQVSVGVAEMRPADEPNMLFERADSALYRAKEAGKGRMVAANAS